MIKLFEISNTYPRWNKFRLFSPINHYRYKSKCEWVLNLGWISIAIWIKYKIIKVYVND
jgi:hypothetical protein